MDLSELNLPPLRSVSRPKSLAIGGFRIEAGRYPKDMVDRTMEGMEIMDPREVIKASSDLLQKTSDVTAKWVSKAAETMEKATQGAKSAAESRPAAAE